VGVTVATAVVAWVAVAVAAATATAAATAQQQHRHLTQQQDQPGLHPDVRLVRVQGQQEEAQQEGDLTYGLLFDAGSTGTRLTVFSWPTRVFDTVLPNLTVPLALIYFSNRTIAGIDTPTGRAFLTVLLEVAQGFLEDHADRWGTFPVYLTATAGMRMLPPAAQATAMAEVRAIIAASPFMFQPGWARIIAGEEEGVYGWVAANYLLGTLQAPDGSLGTSLVGALDMGGASAQVTFLPPSGVEMIAGAFDTTITPSLRTLLYTHSFLYYGQNECTGQINNLVLAAAVAGGAAISNGTVVPHPCYLVGTPFAATAFVSDPLGGLTVYFNGTSNGRAGARCPAPIVQKPPPALPDSTPVRAPTPAAPAAGGPAPYYGPLPPTPAINPPLLGTSASTCTLGGVYQPSLQPADGAPGPNVTLYAFSSYSYQWAFLRLPATIPLTAFGAAVAGLCGMTYAQANATYGTPDNLAFLPGYCLSGAFQYAFLAGGLNIPTDSLFVTVAPTTGVPVTYAAGAMLYFVNSLAWQLPPSPPPPASLAVSLGVPLGVVSALALVACLLWIRARRRSDHYRELHNAAPSLLVPSANGAVRVPNPASALPHV